MALATNPILDEHWERLRGPPAQHRIRPALGICQLGVLNNTSAILSVVKTEEVTLWDLRISEIVRDISAAGGHPLRRNELTGARILWAACGASQRPHFGRWSIAANKALSNERYRKCWGPCSTTSASEALLIPASAQLSQIKYHYILTMAIVEAGPSGRGKSVVMAWCLRKVDGGLGMVLAAFVSRGNSLGGNPGVLVKSRREHRRHPTRPPAGPLLVAFDGTEFCV